MVETQVYNVTFEEDVIITTVTSSGESLEGWLDEVLCVHRRRLHKLVVRLDVEWRPSYSANQNPVAVLQLCISRRCLIFQVIHADYFPDELEDFLGDSEYHFFGVGVEGDADRLWKDWQLKVAKTMDLAELMVQEMDHPSLCRTGLKDIASAVMGADMEMPYRVRTSNWDAYNLSSEQISYACIDAFVSFKVSRKLLSGDYRSNHRVCGSAVVDHPSMKFAGAALKF